MTRSIAMLAAAAIVALVCVLPGVGADDWGPYRMLYDRNHKNG